MGYKSGQNIGIRLMLLRDYLNAHAGKTQAVKREALHAHLESKGFPVERKTLYTDLQLLETYFGMELRYEPRLRGYILENPPCEPFEIRLLVDRINAAKFITQEKVREITRKAKRLANEETRRSLDRQVIVSEHVPDETGFAVCRDDQLAIQYLIIKQTHLRGESVSLIAYIGGLRLSMRTMPELCQVFFMTTASMVSATSSQASAHSSSAE